MKQDKDTKTFESSDFPKRPDAEPRKLRRPAKDKLAQPTKNKSRGGPK